MACPQLRRVHPGREQSEPGGLDPVAGRAGGGKRDIVSGRLARARERDERAEVPLARGA